MKRTSRRKKLLVGVGLTVGLTIAGTGIAMAFFTSTGQGTGSATTGTNTAFAVSSTADTSGDLVPNNGIQAVTNTSGVVDTITYTVTNNSKGDQQLSQIQIQVAGSTGTSPSASPTTWSSQANGSDPACTASDFSVGGATVGSTYTDKVSLSSPIDMTPGQVFTGTVTLQMVDNSANQDNCESLTSVPLFISAS